MPRPADRRSTVDRVRAKRAGERRSHGSRSGRRLPRTALAPRLLSTLVVLVAAALVAASSAAASQTLVSVTIIDDPRPVEKWGYAPASRKVPVGAWATGATEGYEAHSVTALNGAFD